MSLPDLSSEPGQLALLASLFTLSLRSACTFAMFRDRKRPVPSATRVRVGNASLVLRVYLGVASTVGALITVWLLAQSPEGLVPAFVLPLLLTVALGHGALTLTRIIVDSFWLDPASGSLTPRQSDVAFERLAMGAVVVSFGFTVMPFILLVTHPAARVALGLSPFAAAALCQVIGTTFVRRINAYYKGALCDLERARALHPTTVNYRGDSRISLPVYRGERGWLVHSQVLLRLRADLRELALVSSTGDDAPKLTVHTRWTRAATHLRYHTDAGQGQPELCLQNPGPRGYGKAHRASVYEIGPKLAADLGLA